MRKKRDNGDKGQESGVVKKIPGTLIEEKHVQHERSHS
jgi:hypothetical protein